MSLAYTNLGYTVRTGMVLINASAKEAMNLSFCASRIAASGTDAETAAASGKAEASAKALLRDVQHFEDLLRDAILEAEADHV